MRKMQQKGWVAPPPVLKVLMIVCIASMSLRMEDAGIKERLFLFEAAGGGGGAGALALSGSPEPPSTNPWVECTWGGAEPCCGVGFSP